MDKGTIVKIAMALAIVGLVDSAYLTVAHYTNTPVACPNYGIVNCGNVLNSAYSVFFGVPIAVLGLLFFIVEVAVILLKNKDLFVIYNGIGVAMVIYFIYLEYLIGSICVYCTLVHALTALLFILSILYFESGENKDKGVAK